MIAEPRRTLRSQSAAEPQLNEVGFEEPAGHPTFAVSRKTERVLLSESIALVEAHAEESGYEPPTLDPEFAADLEEIINSRKPRNVSIWE